MIVEYMYFCGSKLRLEETQFLNTILISPFGNSQIGRERFSGLKTEILGDAAAFIQQKTAEKKRVMARLDSVIQENAELEMDTKVRCTIGFY